MTGHHISVTRNAVNRWMERIDRRADYEQADLAIRSHAKAVCEAAAFGCRCVVTVLSREQGALSAPGVRT